MPTIDSLVSAVSLDTTAKRVYTCIVTIVTLIVVLLVGSVLISLMIEALRRAPPLPDKLAWAPQIPIQYTTVKGHRLRYIKTGRGPTLVLLHTLRTQLDIFQKIIPSLARRFTVYSLDYPGHGYSDIPRVDYEPALFTEAVAGFLHQLDVRDATVAGVSIGGTIALLLAAQQNPRVTKVVAINPYDYGRGSGLRRSSTTAYVIASVARIPVLGDTVMRFRNRMVEGRIFEGGVAEPADIPPQFMEELYLVGMRRGHYQAFLSLLRHAHKWDDARLRYHDITVPVLLIYGERDWSRPNERHTALQQIPGARMETVAGGGHFLSLDRPREVERLIGEFAS